MAPLCESTRATSVEGENPFQGYRKVQVLALAHERGRDTDHLAARIEDRSAAGAFRNSRGDLQGCRFQIALSCPWFRDRRNDSLGDGFIQTQRTAHHHHVV